MIDVLIAHGLPALDGVVGELPSGVVSIDEGRKRRQGGAGE